MSEPFTDNLRLPLLLFLFSFGVLWFSVWIGTKSRSDRAHDHDEFSIVLGATLTLLGLIIGFTFSMAVSRYDQRKNYEEEEANAIGTEYVRADLLPAASADKVRSFLSKYLHERILFYTTRDARELAQINEATPRLQAELWSAVQVPASAQPSPLVALAVSGMNDVLNSQGYTQAAWWNRIPVAGWVLMVLMAVFANALLGYGARQGQTNRRLLLVLPFIISIAFLLIADIDAPRRGLIRISPQNLISLSHSLHP
jgi:ABC-type sugar transport system permease subunit